MVIAIPSNRSLMSTWTRSNRINITCILLISTNSDKWMKAFRSMPYPCIGPNFEEIYLSLTDLVFPPQWLLPHPECWHIYRLYNDALYKIEKLTFTKDSLEKEKKRNIKYLSIKKRKHYHLLSMIFLNNALMLTFFHHTASLHAFTTLRNPWHLHISDTAYSVTLFS